MQSFIDSGKIIFSFRFAAEYSIMGKNPFLLKFQRKIWHCIRDEHLVKVREHKPQMESVCLFMWSNCRIVNQMELFSGMAEHYNVSKSRHVELWMRFRHLKPFSPLCQRIHSQCRLCYVIRSVDPHRSDSVFCHGFVTSRIFFVPCSQFCCCWAVWFYCRYFVRGTVEGRTVSFQVDAIAI